MTLRSRLARIEAHAPKPESDPGDAERAWSEGFWQRWTDAAERLFATMAPEHIEILMTDYLAGRLYSQDGAHPFTVEVSHLLHCRAWPYRDHLHRTLALTPEMGQALLDGPNGQLSQHCCEDCGLIVPSVHDGTYRDLRSPFERCPLCGGPIVYWSWKWRKLAYETQVEA